MTMWRRATSASRLLKILAARSGACDDRRVKVGRTSVADGVIVVGTRPHPLRDAYHLVLRMRIGWLLALIAAVYLFINLIFAVLYWVAGGVSGMSGSLKDAFFFSVQTMGTIGYGAMYPSGTFAHALVTAESIVSMLVTALVTGVIFARFSQSSGQLVFSDKATISPMNGVPTLSFRVGNDRASTVFEARVKLSLIRTEKTKEGVTFYRMYDLTPQQYQSLIKLTATLCTVFPKINCDAPRDTRNRVTTDVMPQAQLNTYQGVLGHYHIQAEKQDPGPAFQWDRVIYGAQSLMPEEAKRANREALGHPALAITPPATTKAATQPSTTTQSTTTTAPTTAPTEPATATAPATTQSK